MITREQLAQIAHVKLQQPATEAGIAQAEQVLACKFPPDYKELLMISDGLFVGGHISLSLYSTNEIQERNDTYEVTQYVPQDWLLIGDDGGGNGVLLDCGSSEGAVYRVGLGSLQRADAELIAPRLAEWAGKKLEVSNASEDDYPVRVDIWLLRPPAGGPKGLVHLKSALNIEMPIVELRQCLDALPCRVLRDMPLKYARLAAEYNATDPCLRLSEVDHPIPPRPLIRYDFRE